MREDSFPKTVRGFYWRVIKKFPWLFGITFVIGVASWTLGMIFNPLMMKWTTQLFENAYSSNWASVYGLAGMLVGLWASDHILWLIGSLLHSKRDEEYNRYKLDLLYKRIYANDTSFFIDNPGGKIISMAGEVSGNLMFLMELFWEKILGVVLGFMFIIGSLFTMNVWLVVVLLSYGVVKVVWEWIIQKKIKVNKTLAMEEQAKYSGLRNDSMNNILAVKYFANTEYENAYIYKDRERLVKIVKRGGFLNRLQNLPTRILWVFVRLGLLAICFVLVKNGVLSISDGIFVMSSVISINASFASISDMLRDYSTKSARATKAYNNLIAPIQITDKAHAKNLKIKRATIDFDNVSFGYGRNNVFSNFNLHIDSAKKVGVVGLSGAGKTTLCNLLLRMYDVQKGSIKIDGVDIRDVKKDSLLRNISFVPQEITLFNRTIFENIQYARPNATRAQVINAAKKAHIHEFISKLPDGYNTLVGNNGIKLSGGQKQRLSIARAMLKNAPILVLDEATSALDSKNEVMIQKSLANAMRGKTTVVIAHRLSTLRNMDWSIVIKNGKIIEMGSHQQLLRQGGEYKKLWDLQTSGFIS